MRGILRTGNLSERSTSLSSTLEQSGITYHWQRRSYVRDGVSEFIGLMQKPVIRRVATVDKSVIKRSRVSRYIQNGRVGVTSFGLRMIDSAKEKCAEKARMTEFGHRHNVSGIVNKRR